MSTSRATRQARSQIARVAVCGGVLKRDHSLRFTAADLQMRWEEVAEFVRQADRPITDHVF